MGSSLPSYAHRRQRVRLAGTARSSWQKRRLSAIVVPVVPSPPPKLLAGQSDRRDGRRKGRSNMSLKAPDQNISGDDFLRTDGQWRRGDLMKGNLGEKSAPGHDERNGREAMDMVMEELKDVKVSIRTEIEGNQQYFDQQALYTLNDPNSSEEDKAQAREYLDARSENILRMNEEDRRERGLMEAAKKFGKGLMNTMGGVGRGIQSELNDAQHRPTGDIDVRAYDYTNENGKKVHVGAHKRKRS